MASKRQRGIHSVNSGLLKSIHARIMILSVVCAVNTDDVDAELCQIGDIAGTSTRVGQGVYEGRRLKEGVVGIIGGLA